MGSQSHLPIGITRDQGGGKVRPTNRDQRSWKEVDSTGDGRIQLTRISSQAKGTVAPRNPNADIVSGMSIRKGGVARGFNTPQVHVLPHEDRTRCNDP